MAILINYLFVAYLFQESPAMNDIKPEKMTEYRKRAQTLVHLARSYFPITIMSFHSYHYSHSRLINPSVYCFND